MDVEKTMEFMLAQQAKTDSQIAAIVAQQAKTDSQIASIVARQAKAEGQMVAIRKLIHTGMRMIVQQGEAIKEIAQAQKELAQAQKVTERKLQAFIDSLHRGGNGRHSKN